MGKCKDDEDENLIVTFNAENNNFLWWKHLLYKCEVYKRPISNKPDFKSWASSYIISRIKHLIDIKGEKGKKVKPSSYIIGMSSKWSKEKLDENIENFVDNIMQYTYGDKKIRWEN